MSTEEAPKDATVLWLDAIGRDDLRLVGGKAANLGELAQIPGVQMPTGFCVTTKAFDHVVAATPSIGMLLDTLERVPADDGDGISAAGSALRRAIESTALPTELITAVTDALQRAPAGTAWAVRSSATAEDLPTASFAGQQDSFLDIVGPDAVLEHIRRCWASLFTDRAIAYRLHHGIDHRTVSMAVVVQQMVSASASGVLFTADPVTGDRRVCVVEAAPGLGEALAAGHVDPDVWKVRADSIMERTHAPAPALTEAQVLQLAGLGRRLEAHFATPQDIEWCLDARGFHLVQARPITTLFPIPETGDGDRHVFISVGHAQMMTDAMKPLGISFWQMTTPRPMHVAGSRLFVDVAAELSVPVRRTALLDTIGKSDPLVRDALETIVRRGDVVIEQPHGVTAQPGPQPSTPPPPSEPLPTDPAVVEDLIEQSRASIAALQHDIRDKSGLALLDFIATDIVELRRILFDRRSHAVFMSAMDAAHWLNQHLEEWLGVRNAADELTQSVPHNITSEMGLALLDVADAIRPHADVVAFLEHGVDNDFLAVLPSLPGGTESRDAITEWLDRYGARCAGEIDITRPRWSEQPSTLVPLILDNIRNCPPGEAARRFERGHRAAREREREILAALADLPDGHAKVAETKGMIDRLRTFIGYREYPKYGMVRRYAVYKQALRDEAGRLVQAGVLRDADDIFFLSFTELETAVRTHEVDEAELARRKAAFQADQARTPPRVFTSDGEIITGSHQHAPTPAGALPGLPASAGVVEGRARVVLDMAQARFEPGDILVTAYTDPSWTPAFVSVAGLVTEVGGLMTHGAVIAREYGLPAVVGVERATTSILDGQRIRVNGTDGYVEILT